MKFDMITMWYSALKNIKIYDDSEHLKASKYIDNKDLQGACSFAYTFEAQTSCVCAHLMRVWKPKLKTAPFWKIIIFCHPEDEEIGEKESKGLSIDLYYAHCHFDYKDFFKLENTEKKAFILNVIEDTVTKVFEEFDLETEGLKKACEQVRADNYNNEYVWARKRNENKLTAEVVAVHDVLSCKLFFVVKDSKRNVLSRQEFYEMIPQELTVDYHKSKIVWWDDNNTKAKYLTAIGKRFYVDVSDSENHKVGYNQLLSKDWEGTPEEWFEIRSREDAETELALTMINKTPDLNE